MQEEAIKTTTDKVLERDTHYTVGIFSDEDVLRNGVKKLRAEGVNIDEVYSPYPVHFLEDALGYKRSWMPTAAFLFGFLGFACAILMQVYMMGISWPMIIGGKSFIAVPDFVPVTFEMTVLFSAFGMGFTFFISRGLHPFKVPRVFDRRSTDDKHVLTVDLASNKLEEAKINMLLQEVGAEEVYRKDFTEEDEENTSFVRYATSLFTNGVRSSSRKLI